MIAVVLETTQTYEMLARHSCIMHFEGFVRIIPRAILLRRGDQFAYASVRVTHFGDHVSVNDSKQTIPEVKTGWFHLDNEQNHSYIVHILPNIWSMFPLLYKLW